MTGPSSDRYGKDYYSKEFGLDEMRRFNMHWWSVRFYALLADRLLRRSQGRRVMELGCAHGYTLSWLEERYETWGIDISDYAVGRSKTIAPRSRTFQADIGASLPPEIERGGFDLIIAKYVLEHLPRPAEALTRLAGLLAPGGALLYSVPDTTSPGRRFKGDAWFALGDETHISLLDPPQWLQLTQTAGLSIERQFSDGLWDAPYVRFVPRLIQLGIFGFPTIVSVFFARPMIPAGWGENLIVVARKPVKRSGG